MVTANIVNSSFGSIILSLVLDYSKYLSLKIVCFVVQGIGLRTFSGYNSIERSPKEIYLVNF